MKNLSTYREVERMIWESFDALRGSLEYNNFHILNLLLVLQKEGLINNDVSEREEFHKMVGDNVQSISDPHLEPLKEIYSEFEEVFHKLSNRQLLRLLSVFNRADSEILRNDFALIFDAILERISNGVGKYGSETLQANELTRLMNYFVSKEGTKNVYNPFAGMASFALDLPKEASYYGQELNKRTCAIARLRIIAHGKFNKNITFKCEDSMSNWIPSITNQKFDLIIGTPPFSMKLNKSDEIDSSQKTSEGFFIEKAMKSLSKTGKAVIASPQGILYRLGAEQRLRQELIEQDNLEMIISLPSGVLHNTLIPIVVFVLNNNKKNKGSVLFVDASKSIIDEKQKTKTIDVVAIQELIENKEDSKTKRLVTSEELIESDFNFNPKRHLIEDVLPEEDTELVCLGDLITEYDSIASQLGETGKVVRIKDLSDNFEKIETNFSKLEQITIPHFGKKLPKNSLLLSLRWNTLKPTFFTECDEDIYYSYTDIYACEINEKKIDKGFLLNELRKDYVSSQIEKYSVGSTISTIKKADLLLLKIKVPSIEKQKDEVSFQKAHELHNLETKLEKLREEYGFEKADENSLLRHKIAGTLKNVRGAFDSLKSILDSQVVKEYPQINELKISESMKLNFGNYIKILERDLNNIHTAVIETGEELEMFDFNISQINIVEFVEQYCNELNSSKKRGYDVVFTYDKEVLAESNLKNIFIKGDESLLRKMFDNLVENAEKHAFQNSISINNKIEFDIDFDFEYKKEVSIDVANTGNPLPPKMKFEEYIEKGNKKGKNSGDGIGGWYINEIMKKHGGRLEFTDETDFGGIPGEYVTTFELFFPININDYE